jgi:cellobiose-specific phosphotransferase system component IIA
MTDDSHQPADGEDRSTDHQHAREACEHAVDALSNGDLARAHALLDEARAAVERAQHDNTEQAYRETAYDCYD